MSIVLLALAALVAVVSGARGVWSPCGLSMLSSITPMTEAGRGNRFRVTAAWFLVGSTLGGLSLGALAAGGAAGLGALHLGLTTRVGIAAGLAIVTAGIDLGALGVDLPIFKRQVNDGWLRRYRSWAYGAGFGWQIGFGVATYIMTAGVFLTIGLAVLTARPIEALLLATLFGLVRGSAVYVSRSATTPAALGRVHERLDAGAPGARAAAAAVQVLAASVFAFLAWHPVAGVAVLAIAAAAAIAGGKVMNRRPERSVDAAAAPG